eukprot:COSAG02_NODE_1498_length_12281_cov_14.846741_6_plen_200_part_00
MKVQAGELVRLMQKYGGKIPPLFRQIERTETEELLEACLDEATGEDLEVFADMWYVTWPKNYMSHPNAYPQSRREMDHPVRKIREKCVAYADEHESVLREYKKIAFSPFMNPCVSAEAYRRMSPKDLVDACCSETDIPGAYGWRDIFSMIDVDASPDTTEPYDPPKITWKEAREQCLYEIEPSLAQWVGRDIAQNSTRS